jgi:superfamily II DNA or RNA helicase
MFPSLDLSSPMQITEKLLVETGGWQVFKHARGLHAGGRVSEAVQEGGELSGYVREGETRYRAGLRFLSRTNVENLCTCKDSRARGLICAHSVAVALGILQPAVSQPAPVIQAPPVGVPPQRSVEARGFSKEVGKPVELHVVFPPNLGQAAARGGASIGVEAVCAGRRVLLNALETRETYRCDNADWRLLEALVLLQEGGALPGMFSLGVDPLLALFEALDGHPRVTIARRAPLRVGGESVRPVLYAETRPNGDWALRCELPAGGALFAGKKAAWLLRDAALRPVCAGLPFAYLSLLQGEVVLPAGAVGTFVEREWAQLRACFDCERIELPGTPSVVGDGFNSMQTTGATVDPHALAGPVFIMRLEGSLNFLTATLTVAYGDVRTTLTNRSASGRRGDRAAEGASLARLSGCGFSVPDADGQMVLRGEPAILSFFACQLPGLQRDWKVEIGERFEHVTRQIERIEPRLKIQSSGENWFELDVSMASADGERYSGAELRRLIQSGRSHVKRNDGTVAVFDPGLLTEFEEVLRDCTPEQRQPGRYLIANKQAGFLEAFAGEHGTTVDAPPHWRQWASASRRASELRTVPLGALEEVLRPYQKHGVYWMHFLAENGLGGILADEMGLGKTVQALGLLGTIRGRKLVVAPSSLLINWQREAERFLPGARVLVLSGGQRHEKFAREWAEAELVITSYPLLRLDAERLCAEKFAAVILDEAQHIKNPDSQAAQAAYRLRSERRFVLTGTPVENAVRDVWSLLHFLMPGYLGSRADFKERYEQPVAREPGGPEHRRMIQRLSPFVLRRTKKAVAPELPDKIEQVVWCELSSSQREAYARLVDLSRREVSKAEGMKNQGQARMLMLTALLRLRQVCNDLRLLGDELPGDPGSGAADESGKMEALGELLEEAVGGGHRVLLFSQFASMLDLLQQWLEERGVSFCRLDGSTRDRSAQVDRFQTGSVPVFLISLKAGGVGLNLTAADTVVHFDPWWNPAVEAQATDRAHRIGQKSTVTSYKLITRGTVEEKILQLQQRKRSLMEALVESEQPLMDGLTMDEIANLLEA